MLVAAAGALLLLVLLASAWVSDDAFITLRTAARFHAGDGLTWNPGERVQAYTHPLWLALLLVFTGVTREYFFTTVVVALVTTAAFVVLAARGRSPSLVVLLLLALGASRAFVDFAVSGLENPLLALLLVVLSLVGESPRRTVFSTLVLSALFLTRPDAVLLGAPVWLALHRAQRPRVAHVALGALPALAWELFSFIYYGAWVPNTALAKLNLAVPWSARLASGAAYLVDSLQRDPVTLVLLIAGVAVAAWRGSVLARGFAVGAVLGVVYVLPIGGDFMSGRFLMAPFVAAMLAAALTLAQSPVPPRVTQALTLLLLVYPLAWPHAPLRTGAHFGEGYREAVGPRGIVDERAYYFPWAGLVPVLRNDAKRDLVPTYDGACLGRALAQSDRRMEVVAEVGMFGFFAGEKVVVDWFSLADPLLARIPYTATQFRPGHYPRPFPPGYVETRETGENRLVDAGLRAAWDDLVLVTRAPVFDAERWAALRRLHSGAHDDAFTRAARNPWVAAPDVPPPPECDGW